MDRRIAAYPGQHMARGAWHLALLLLLALALSGCASTPRNQRGDTDRIAQAMTAHIEVLASDEFGGRRPGTDGERLTLDYMRRELEAAGLVSGTNDPANPWLAPVELIKTAAGANSVELINGRDRIALSADEAFATTNLRRSLLEYAPLVFAGYSVGEPAPDQFVGQVVILIGADGDIAREREAAFSAGAAAVMQLVDDPQIVATIRDARSKERFRLAEEVRDELTVYVTETAFARVVGEAPYAALAARAEMGKEAFVGQQLDTTARIEANSQARGITSHNLIAKLAGTRPQDGALVLMGHWDHFGTCGEEGATDRICNGAIDNASGIAMILELAERLSASGPHDRDIYVLGTTAEEWGLLGAKAFLAQPPLPLEEIAMTFNFDSVAIARAGSPVVFVGQGHTPADERIMAAIERSGRVMGSQITADLFLKRQDSWAFLEVGVPAVALTSGLGEQAQLDAFLAARYHQASDNPGELELGGAVQDLLLHEDLVTELASTARYPGGGE